jgi:nucleoside-diphosphate kinase
VQESTLVIVKPEAYARGLTGIILARLQQRGLVLEAIRVSRSEVKIIEEHYPRTESWLASVGNKTLQEYQRLGIPARDSSGTDDPIAIGRSVHDWLTEYLLSGPLVPMVLSGYGAIDTVRKLVGNTIPVLAEPGTIRGDYSSDSAIAANREKRAVRNIVHASGDLDEAVREIKLWFPELDF